MAKKKTLERGEVKLGLNDLSDETYKLVQRLDDMASTWAGMGLTADELLQIAQALKDECGGESRAWIKLDDYFGNSVDMCWTRPETDDEWTKRLYKNKHNALVARKDRAADKQQK